MELDKWIDTYKVRAFPWIDGKTIYVNVQYFVPGQSIVQPPKWDKSVLISDNDDGRRLVYEFTHSLIQYISRLNLKPVKSAKGQETDALQELTIPI